MINRMVVYDFDGTLFRSPEKEEGMHLYAQKVGKPYPHKGWWGRMESLMPPIVPMKPDISWYLAKTIDQYRLDKSCPNTNILLMTGRINKFRSRIESLLAYQNIHFPKIYFSNDPDSVGSNTFEIKSNRIEKLLTPNIELLEIWEDRPDQIEQFHTWSLKLQKNLCHLVKISVHDVMKDA